MYMAGAASAIRFDGVLERIGDRTIVRLPESASAALPSRGQVAAVGTNADHAHQTLVEPDGRRGHWLAIDDDLADALGGDATVAVELTPAKEWPEPSIPADLRAALTEATDLAETWDDITPMARWEWVRWVGATKNPQTRERRVEVSIDKLRNGKRRPCCFDLSSCTDPELAKSGKLIDAG
jgi:hypothetical protein